MNGASKKVFCFNFVKNNVHGSRIFNDIQVTSPFSKNRILSAVQRADRIHSYRDHNTDKLSNLNRTASSIAVNSDGFGDEKKSALNFDDYTLAFQNKSFVDLLRALGILYMCSSDILVRNSYQILESSRKILGRRLFYTLVKPTLFKQFVGGDTEETITRAVQKLQNDGIGPMLMLPMEEDAGQEAISDSWYDRNLDLMIKGLKLTKNFGEKYPMLQIKLTALLSGCVCQKLSECCPEPSADPESVETIAKALHIGNDLSKFKDLAGEELDQVNKALTRIRKLCIEAKDQGVLLLVDAEYTYLNPALNLLALAMMCHTADKKPIVMYTYQNYLKATHKLLCRDVDFILANGVCFGSKLVRGAYMDKERKLAGVKGYPDPICDTFEDTTDTYNKSMDTMLRHIATESGRVATVIATHNEETVHTAVKRMQTYNIEPTNDYVFFAQVYGMGDFMSVILGQSKYQVYKSIPYGIPEDTLPYLSRRVTENRAVLDGARRERVLLKATLKERLMGRRRSTEI